MARRKRGTLDLGIIDRLRLGWRLLRDPRVPMLPKLLGPALAVIYVVSPIDAIPDFIPVLGQLDDLGVITLAVAVVGMLARWAPLEVVQQHAASLGLADLFGEGQPGGRTGDKDEPIEAKYWVDEWR